MFLFAVGSRQLSFLVVGYSSPRLGLRYRGYRLDFFFSFIFSCGPALPGQILEGRFECVFINLFFFRAPTDAARLLSLEVL